MDRQFGNVSYYITISISNISNENVTRVLEERAKHVGALFFAVTVTQSGPKLVIQLRQIKTRRGKREYLYQLERLQSSIESFSAEKRTKKIKSKGSDYKHYLCLVLQRIQSWRLRKNLNPNPLHLQPRAKTLRTLLIVLVVSKRWTF